MVRVGGSSQDPPGLPVGSLALRVGNSPQGVYQTLGPHCCPFAPQEYVYVPFIDDILYAQISRDWVIVTQDTSICLHLQLGFIINLAKSSLIPSQVMTHLGARIDTLSGLVKPSLDKIQEINRVSLDLLTHSCMSPPEHGQSDGFLSCYSCIVSVST